jgi:hypothetical protein
VADMRRTLDKHAAGTPDDHLEHVRLLELSSLRFVYDSIHPSRREDIMTKSFNQISSAIHANFRTRTIQLIITPSITVRRIQDCYLPSHEQDSDPILQRSTE